MTSSLAALFMAVSVMSCSYTTDLGHQRITTYCPECNDGQGYESSSGKKLEYGDCACSWLPIGTKINIEGAPFTVVDICGTDAIDIFVDTEDCECNLNEYRKVVRVHESNVVDVVSDRIDGMASKGMD